MNPSPIRLDKPTPPPIPGRPRNMPPLPRSTARETFQGDTEIPEHQGTTRRADLRVAESREANNQLEIGAASEASIDHPSRNEDTYFYSPDRGVVFIADGMGGVPAGDRASAKAAETLSQNNLGNLPLSVQRVFGSSREVPFTQQEVEAATGAVLEAMNTAVEKMVDADPAILEKAKAQFEEELGHAPRINDVGDQRVLRNLLKSIGCAGSLAKIWQDKDGKDHITIGQAGDTRIYRLRKGKLEKLTRDDSPLNILIEAGIKDRHGKPVVDDQDITQEISREAITDLADRFPALIPLKLQLLRGPAFVSVGSLRNRISQAIGAQRFFQEQAGLAFKPEITTEELQDEDMFIALTDGITDNLLDEEIEEVLQQYMDPLEVAQELQMRATLRSIKGKNFNPRAKTDDATAVVTVYRKKQNQALQTRPTGKRAAA